MDGGRRLESAEVTGSMAPPDPLVLGHHAAILSGRGLEGSLDHVMIFNRRWAPAEVIELFWGVGGLGPVGLVPEADAFVRAGADTDVNYGNDWILNVKADNEPDYRRKSYLRFNLNGVGDFSAASVVLTMNARGPIAATHEAWLTADDWQEMSITWSNAPGTTSSGALDSWSAPADGNTTSFDVTAVATAAAGDDGLLSILLRAPTDLGSDAWSTYSSRRFPFDVAPKLLLTP